MHLHEPLNRLILIDSDPLRGPILQHIHTYMYATSECSIQWYHGGEKQTSQIELFINNQSGFGIIFVPRWLLISWLLLILMLCLVCGRLQHYTSIHSGRVEPAVLFLFPRIAGKSMGSAKPRRLAQSSMLIPINKPMSNLATPHRFSYLYLPS